MMGSVYWRMAYACVLLVSMIAASRLLHRTQNRLDLTRPQRWLIGGSAFAGAMIGAKVPFLGERGWEAFYSGTVWFADGKTILGGIVGGYVAVELAKWIAKIKTRTGDSFALPVAVAVAIGRVGCFVAGCCYGTETTLPWGFTFPLAGDEVGVLRHPTQLYEVAFHGFAAIALLMMDRRRWFVGNQLKVYLIAYFGYRFLSEWLRPESSVLLNLTYYQLASAVLIAILSLLWIRDSQSIQPQTNTTSNQWIKCVKRI